MANAALFLFHRRSKDRANQGSSDGSSQRNFAAITPFVS
jgi:hypothetical protein